MHEEPKAPAGGEPQSFDAFWAEVQGTATTTIRGIEIRVPTGMTIAAERVAKASLAKKGTDGFVPLAQDLFRAPDGHRIPDLWDRWEDAGMERDELQVVVAWGLAHARGNPISFAEALQHVRDAEAEAEEAEGEQGKASPRKTSSGSDSGGRSKAASARRTGSKPRKSRT